LITYNKEFRKKDGRLLVASGPRSLQNRPAYDDDDITELKGEIARLKMLLGAVDIGPNNTLHNDSDLNDAINDAVSKALLEVETDNVVKFKNYELKITALDTEIEVLKAKLGAADEALREQIKAYEDRLYTLFKIVAKKDEIIGEMTSNLLTGGSSLVTRAKAEVPEETTVQRPNIDDVFIDPNKGGEDGMKSHVKIKEIKNDTDVSNSVDKLRGLLGKLPEK